MLVIELPRAGLTQPCVQPHAASLPPSPTPPTHPRTYSYYGHDEADFGIAYMFGGLDSSFYEAYESLRPLRDRPMFEERKVLYELHHHLNHFNIFGGSYQQGALGLMRKLIKVTDAP